MAGGAKGFYILGLICEKKKKNKDALLYYKRAFKLDPSLWIAFEKVCQLDVSFSISLTDLFGMRKAKKEVEENFPNRKFRNTRNFAALYTPRKRAVKCEQRDRTDAMVQKKEHKRVKVPFLEPGIESRKRKMEEFIMKKLVRGKAKRNTIASESRERRDPNPESIRVQMINQRSGLISKRASPEVSQYSRSNSKCRRRRKLHLKKGPQEENLMKQPEVVTGRLVSANAKNLDLLKKYLTKLGYAYRMMTLGRFKESINIFNSLSSPLLKLHFVLVNTAICYMHLVKYKNAEKIFNYAFEKEPYESYGLDFYRYPLTPARVSGNWTVPKLCTNWPPGLSTRSPSTKTRGS